MSDRALYVLNGGLGDVVMALPALQAAHARFGLPLDLVLANRAGEQVLAGLDHVGRIWHCPNWSLARAPAILALGWRLRRQRYAVAIYGGATGSPKTRLLLWLAGADRSVPAGELETWQRPRAVPGHKTAIALRNLGIECSDREPPAARLIVDGALAARAERVLADWGLADRRFVVLWNGAGVARFATRKLITEARLIAIARAVVARDHAVVYLAGPDETEAGARLVQALGADARLADQFDLMLYAGIAARARLGIGNDTGLMHLVAAAGAPVLGLFGPTVPAITGPAGADHRLLRACARPGGCYRGGQDLIAGCTATACLARIADSDIQGALDAALT